MKYRLSILLLTLILAACGSSRKAVESNDILSIVHGTSFGHCRGYCIKEIRYEPGSITFTQINRDSVNFPKKIYVEHFTKEEFNLFSEKLDRAKWQALDTVINCPDCADRGAEYLIISTTSGTKKVLYDAWSNPEGMESLLTVIREKRKLLEAELAQPEE